MCFLLTNVNNIFLFFKFKSEQKIDLKLIKKMTKFVLYLNFNFPNKITEMDFANWVQERNLYTLTSFDDKYTPLLESHDAGEQENKGGLVIAKVGKGNWVYCSYSFFRQLPAGIPGAYRLFANLMSLPKTAK